jgi:hypothetical protein
MTALMAGSFVGGAAVVAGLGWYGRKAFRRINTWGKALDERERIICTGDCHLCMDPRFSRLSCGGQG